MSEMTSPEPMRFEDAAQWEAWLTEHHGDTGGVWLLIAKKGSGLPLLSIEDAAYAGLCFGWIDSHRRGYDEHIFLQRFSRRRRRSPWSRINVGRVESLIAAGRMRAPGLAEMAAAQQDGRWARALGRDVAAS
ncbi:YdeI family protein [Nocardia sp. NPDC057668]|uniref:YdeI/OmpD-associated family protein n=1 Tax=Nocardia sp. NPDC057668 TaxID=3346202 RepID=UPI0036727EBE